MIIANADYLTNALDDYADAIDHYGAQLPTVEHCIGTKRLLGENYGPAICEVFEIEKNDIQSQLTELCVLLRTYIVLDDHQKDTTKINISVSKYIAKCLKKIQKRTLYLLEKFGSDDERLWYYHLAQINEAYLNFDYERPFNSVLKKCSFVFLPFNLSILPHDSTLKKDLEHFIKYFLFSLQLLDDFHDMEEDLSSNINHNLFVANKPANCVSCLIRGRRFVLFSALQYMKKNLSKAYKKAFNNSLIGAYCKNSIAWIDLNLMRLDSNFQVSLLNGRYEDFNMRNETIVNFETELLGSRAVQIADIRAENMHTI